MSISVLNTSANLSGKTLLTAENPYTQTGLITFDRDPSAPFAVTAGSAVVPNLTAESLSGGSVAATTVSGTTATFTGALVATTGTFTTVTYNVEGVIKQTN